MILTNAKIYGDGLLRKGIIHIEKGIIKNIIYYPDEQVLRTLYKQNNDNIEIDCENKIIIPGIIDIHSHLRDLEQSNKETFLTGTEAAAISGITTVFNMPNTQPPAISSKQIKKWMKRAENNIYVNVAFIAGVPKDINYDEMKRIINLGVIGFKIYPLNSINGVNWIDQFNIQKLFHFSSIHQIPIFIHPDWPLSQKKKEEIIKKYEIEKKKKILELHNDLYPCQMEAKYVSFILENYYKIINNKDLKPKNYPIIHFCHISCIESYSLIEKAINQNSNLKITFEITPHHLLLSNKVPIKNENIGKVLPPLRDDPHPQFLYSKLKERKIYYIGSDHAPHTLKEKLNKYLQSPSGFPGFETYPLILLNKVCHYELDLATFVKISSENPAILFNLKRKGFIKIGYDADLIVVDKISEYPINPEDFKTKAKFSPFKEFKTSVQIWKVIIGGYEIINDKSKPTGKIIKRSI